MNPIKTGRYIALKRKELNMTQEQLAEKVGVTNKSVSKWETGKCMPDTTIMEPLCQELGISFDELLNGESTEKNIENKIEKHTLQALQEIEKLKREKNLISGILLGVLLIVLGTVLISFSKTISGIGFIPGLLSGISISLVLVGVFITIYTLSKTEK